MKVYESGHWRPFKRSRFGYFTANDKLRFAVNGFTLPIFPYLGLEIRGGKLAAAMFAYIHPLSPILAEKLSSKENSIITK